MANPSFPPNGLKRYQAVLPRGRNRSVVRRGRDPAKIVHRNLPGHWGMVESGFGTPGGAPYRGFTWPFGPAIRGEGAMLIHPFPAECPGRVHPRD
ncbi:MAG TPA: hypothetical protein VN203_20020, partial [Candidatus Acidoferrum sp.]|nr:hypothetical protein [Candidatus Acidoferrum sp.]